jgi:hypothetical protein
MLRAAAARRRRLLVNNYRGCRNNRYRFNGIMAVVAAFMLMAALLASCGAGAGPPQSGAAAEGQGGVTCAGVQASSESAILSGTIAQVKEGGTFLLAGSSAHELYVAYPDSGLEVCGADGKTGGADSLRVGQRVDVAFNGAVEESYPAQITSERITVIEDGDDMVGLYLDILEALWNDDPALNPSGSGVHKSESGSTAVGKGGNIAYDLTGLNNLTEGEKGALIWLNSERLGTGGFAATYDELVNDGYIEPLVGFKDTNNLLIEISTKEERASSFKFKMSKRVGGLGANWYDDCTATKKNGEWSFELGGFAVS